MANNLAGGFGLRPIGLVGAGANTTGTTQYEIASNNTNAIYQGGIVIPTAAGVIDITDQAVAPLGVFYGVEYVDSGTKKTTFKNAMNSFNLSYPCGSPSRGSGSGASSGRIWVRIMM